MTHPHPYSTPPPATGGVAPTLSPLAVTLATYIATYRTRRVPLDDLRNHAYTSHPTLHTDLHARTRLRDALTELADATLITLPAARTKTGWDTHMQPPLPTWVLRPAATTPVVVNPRRDLYPARLETAAALATRPDEYALLNTIADWLRDHPHPQPVPIEERSLELFGHEKALTGLLATRLFETGALTLTLLAAHRTPVPLPSTHLPGTGPTRLLVVENQAAYYSLVTATRRLPHHQRPDLHIACGGGNAFALGHAEITFLDPAPTRAYYAGDLDWAGVTIAVRAAAAIAASPGHTPPLEPAVSHYRHLLAHGRRQPDDPSNRTPLDPATLTETLAWFPPDLQPAIQTLLEDRARISQETIGLDTLTAHPALIQHL